jgi:hypothetical protein
MPALQGEWVGGLLVAGFRSPLFGLRPRMLLESGQAVLCVPSQFLNRRCSVTGNSSDQLWVQKLLEFHCDDCGGETGFRSRRRTFSERYILPILLLQPVRCAECFRRDYRLVFMPVKERLPETVKKVANPVTRTNRNVA